VIDKVLRTQALSTKGFMPEKEGDALYLAACAACKELPKLPIVEIGTYCGRSTVWLGAAARKYRAKVFAIDHHFGSEENQHGWEWFDESLLDSATNKLNTLPSLLATLRRTRLCDVVIPVVGESRVISSQWSAKIAFCFIDGGHGDEPARSDYLSWVPKIEVKGLLAIHDVFEDPKDGGQAPYKHIYKAALDSGEFVEISATGSLRILRRIKIAG
jgi:predicted O-methyltransferase YrrM